MLKELLKIYIDGINLVLYKNEVLSYREFKDKYDKRSEYYNKLIKHRDFDYTWVNSILRTDPDIQELEYKCTSSAAAELMILKIL